MQTGLYQWFHLGMLGFIGLIVLFSFIALIFLAKVFKSDLDRKDR